MRTNTAFITLVPLRASKAPNVALTMQARTSPPMGSTLAHEIGLHETSIKIAKKKRGFFHLDQKTMNMNVVIFKPFINNLYIEVLCKMLSIVLNNLKQTER